MTADCGDVSFLPFFASSDKAVPVRTGGELCGTVELSNPFVRDHSRPEVFDSCCRQDRVMRFFGIFSFLFLSLGKPSSFMDHHSKDMVVL